MERTQINDVVSRVIPQTKSVGDTIKKRTVKDTFHIGGLSGNRLNSGTLRSQFIICEKESDWTRCDSSAKKAIHSDQRVFVQKEDDVWDVYKGKKLESETEEPELILKNQPGLEKLLLQARNDIMSDMSLFETGRPKGVEGHQIVYYGAPGTGKSHTVKKQTEGESVVRTSFHPDSDYSTFVGCYKPTMGGGLKDVISITDLKKKLFDIKLKGEAYPCQKFGAQYWNSLANLSQVDVKDILVACGFTESMSAEIGKGISVGKEMYSNSQDSIVYEFVDQAFLKAYVKAWKFYADAENGDEPKKQYLIIEEINRGNCAQIFGDLFQLLDRNSAGFSDYSIHTDKDMRRFLEKEFRGVMIDEARKEVINAMYNNDEKDVVSKVLSGEILMLPSNLYIWATMNTSDQSLFPIDSAFKRRWDWEYEPIKYKNINWVIEVQNNRYSWVSFQKIINDKIFNANSSEDKMLGDYFVNPATGVITEKMLLNKILFYLWNDVCKDGEGDIFKVSETEDVTFSELHGEGGAEKLVAMMKYLGVTSAKNTVEDDLNNELIDQESKTWYQDLWTDVSNSLVNKGQANLPTPRSRQTYQLSVGLTGISVLANLPRTKASGYVGYYIERQQASDIYPKLLTLKEAIEDKLGVLDWLREGDRYAVVKRNLDTSGINNDGLRNEIVENVSTLLVDFKDAILPLIDQLR